MRPRLFRTVIMHHLKEVAHRCNENLKIKEFHPKLHVERDNVPCMYAFLISSSMHPDDFASSSLVGPSINFVVGCRTPTGFVEALYPSIVIASPQIGLAVARQTFIRPLSSLDLHRRRTSPSRSICGVAWEIDLLCEGSAMCVHACSFGTETTVCGFFGLLWSAVCTRGSAYSGFMASRAPVSSEIIESSSILVALTHRPDLSLSQHTPAHRVTNYFGFLQSRWEDLAQYEPLSDFPTAAATIVSQRLARQHIYQFLMGLKSEYESLCIQILNTSPLPFLYEAFAIIDEDEHRRRLIQASPAISPGSTPIADQMVFAASSSSPRSSGGKPVSSYCENIGHIRERYFKLHPELKGTPFKRKGKSHRTATVAETSPGHVPNLSHIQSQLGLLQSQLGSLLQQQPLGSTATLATGTPTAFHAKTGHPTWVLDSGINDHMTSNP
ncbi:hypothetical protein Acr_22g0007590 [Actinidia rufa]|uniref:Uncharacterized protein n=1 Tax=Actinidia rufa TaxID=165716 RepID=A0A7J0GKU1_9ERIC|nr:hypothetical protein Acr_22g0007590 [Actinidia rufa]